MTRRPRIEFVSAVYHVISRGVHGEAIYQDEEDRQGFFNGGKSEVDQTEVRDGRCF